VPPASGTTLVRLLAGCVAAACAFELPAPPVVRATTGAGEYTPFTLGLGIGFGTLVNAGDQRRYVEARLAASNDGFVDTPGWLSGSGAILAPTLAPVRYLRLAGLAEYALTPIAAVGDTRFFIFTRASAGGLALFEIPVTNSSLVAVDLGGGPIYHWVGFQEHQGSTLGVRAQVAFIVTASESLFGEIAVAYDRVPAVSDQDLGFALDYSAILINGVIHFGFGQR
jgi:hypothetical protein